MDKAFSRFLLVLSIAAFCHSGVQASTPCDSVSQKKMEQTWKEFRDIHPSCFQTIALKHYGGDTCVFVMSEPPGWVSQDSIKKLFNSYGGHVGIGNHTCGYDGVLTDAIGCVKLGKNKFSSFESKLFKLFYGSDYKAYYTNLDKPVPHTYSLPATFNYKVDAEDLYYIENAPLFSLMILGDLRHNELHANIINIQMTNHSPSVLHYSSIPKYKYVAWILNPNIVAEADSAFKADARQFLLDTDLIIGAIPSPQGLALIGRERKTSINVLPPLRAETIMLLAQHAKDTLSVSFDTGQTECVDDTTFATPVMLSNSLKKSEVGNLMISATGMLMSYANKGVFDYFAPDSLSSSNVNALGITQMESYPSCWHPNFDGCLHTIAIGDSRCMYPMLYEGEDNIIAEEESNKAYEYFTALRPIDMVRLKQYAFIHEAFKMQRRFTRVSQDKLPDNFHVWMEAPTTIVTNAPFINSSFVMQ